MDGETVIKTIMDCLEIEEDAEGVEKWKKDFRKGLERIENGGMR